MCFSTKTLSQKFADEQSNFVCGRVIHFINNKFYVIDAHDVGEVNINMANMFDHFTYQWVGDVLEQMIAD